jgi:ATP-dependent DNA helicase PIF1
MTIRAVEKKWLENFKKCPLIDKETGQYLPDIARQVFYGKSTPAFPEDYPNDLEALFQKRADYARETAIDNLVEFLHLIGIKIHAENITKHLESFPDDFDKLFRKAYYIFKALAHHGERINIASPYSDNMGDLHFLLRVETGQAQASLFEESELPVLYKRIANLPDGYENDNVVNDLFNAIEETNTSYFITGKAGTGKSTFIRYFTQKTNKKAIILAFTGIAAVNVSGQTIHSFFKFPLKPLMPQDHEIPVFKEYNQIRKIIEKVQTIIIDEVSMLRADVLEAIDYSLRKNGGVPNLPFGGKQILFVGDAFQLPPVVESEDEVTRYLFTDVYKSQYFFDSPAYKLLNPKFFEFAKVYRQQEDLRFVELLDKVRICEIDGISLTELNTRYYPKYVPRNEDFVITLTSTNGIASAENLRRLTELNYNLFTFEASITGDFKADRYPTAQKLELKRFAQVIFIKNDSTGRWVNGTIAKIEFISNDHIEIKLQDGQIHKIERQTWENRKYKYDRQAKKVMSEVVGTFTQYPIKLAWAITIHKSQGLTFEKVVIDLGTGAFVNGQAYTALSRCKSFAGIALKTQLRPEDIISDSRITNFYFTEQTLNSIEDI